MFNSYYANLKTSQNVTVNTPSSIMGTLVKSHKNSVITAMKIDSQEFNDMFGTVEQKVQDEHYYGSSEWERSKNSSRAVVLQTMLANSDMIFVEYVVVKEEED